jgi:hypothetical protein
MNIEDFTKLVDDSEYTPEELHAIAKDNDYLIVYADFNDSKFLTVSMVGSFDYDILIPSSNMDIKFHVKKFYNGWDCIQRIILNDRQYMKWVSPINFVLTIETVENIPTIKTKLKHNTIDVTNETGEIICKGIIIDLKQLYNFKFKIGELVQFDWALSNLSSSQYVKPVLMVGKIEDFYLSENMLESEAQKWYRVHNIEEGKEYEYTNILEDSLKAVVYYENSQYNH